MALKLLRERLAEAGGSEAEQRFRREVAILAELDHPSLPRLRDSGLVDGRPYLVMDLVEGEDLAARLARGEVPVATRLAWLRQLADAARVIHAVGVVHRDIKPENLLVAEDGRLVLADFGLAHGLGLESITGTGKVVGTPLYMAPEQFEGLEADPRMDLYSWGAVAFTLLEGRPPHDAGSIGDLIRGKACAPLEAPGARAAGGEALETLVLECMLWEPDDRPTGAAEIVERLDTLGGRAPDPLGGWKLAAAALFLPLVVAGYLLSRPGGPDPWVDAVPGYGALRVRTPRQPLPEQARLRLRRGEEVLAERPLGAPGEEVRVPVTGREPVLLELVEGEQVLARRSFLTGFAPPGLRLLPGPEALEVALTEPAREALEVRLLAPPAAPRQVQLEAGSRGVRFLWTGAPARYRVEVRRPGGEVLAGAGRGPGR